MAITVTAVGGSTPPLLQVVVSATTVGVAWTLTGSAGGQSWTVPGGAGVGDGNALVRVDNRTPLNTPITYTYTPATGSAEVASPVTVTSVSGMVLQSLDGQKIVSVDLLNDSGSLELLPDQAMFKVPGRPRPVIRYNVTGDGGGSLHVGMDSTLTADFRELCASGAPVLVRRQEMGDDMPLVFVALFTKIGSDRFATDIGYREWVLPYLYVDDPYLDVALGAFSWDAVDTVMAGRTWTQFDTVMSGLTWTQFDVLDWSTV